MVICMLGTQLSLPSFAQGTTTSCMPCNTTKLSLHNQWLWHLLFLFLSPGCFGWQCTTNNSLSPIMQPSFTERISVCDVGGWTHTAGFLMFPRVFFFFFWWFVSFFQRLYKVPMCDFLTNNWNATMAFCNRLFFDILVFPLQGLVGWPLVLRQVVGKAPPPLWQVPK